MIFFLLRLSLNWSAKNYFVLEMIRNQREKENGKSKERNIYQDRV